MSGHRQSALLLHGLNRADQQWLLNQLAEPDQRCLRDHLAELRSLGIPASAGLTPEPGAGVQADTALTVEHASAEQMQQVLSDEPLWLQQQLLAAAAWRWRDAYLSLLSPIQRQRLAEHSARPLSERTVQALVSQVNQRLQAGPAPSPAAAPVRPAGLLHKLRRALGWPA